MTTVAAAAILRFKNIYYSSLNSYMTKNSVGSIRRPGVCILILTCLFNFYKRQHSMSDDYDITVNCVCSHIAVYAA